MIRIGLVSDTHGRLDPRVLIAFEGVDRIIHAGDICSPHLIFELETVAPVTAVLGNCDDPFLLHGVEALARITVEGVRIVVAHNRTDLPGNPADADVVVFGHSHRPLVQQLGEVLWVNPGSAQQARGASVGTSVALLEVDRGAASARIVPLSQVREA